MQVQPVLTPIKREFVHKEASCHEPCLPPYLSKKANISRFYSESPSSKEPSFKKESAKGKDCFGCLSMLAKFFKFLKIHKGS